MTVNKTYKDPMTDEASLKAYLMQTFIFSDRIQRLQRQLDCVKSQLTSLPSSTSFSAVRVQTSGAQEAPFEPLMMKKELWEADLEKLYAKLDQRKQEIERLLYRHITGLDYCVLYARYVLNQTWPQIASDCGFSERHARRIHNGALTRLLASVHAARAAG